MEEKIYPYLVAVNLEHQFGIDETQFHVPPENYTNPALYCPPVTVVVHGIEDPTAVDPDESGVTLGRMLKEGLAVPLVGFRGHVLLQHALWLADIDPREYFLEEFPEHAKIPEQIIGVPYYDDDLDHPEDCPNVLILDSFDIFTDAGAEHLDYILDRLNTLVLSSCGIPVNLVVYPTPKLSDILSNPIMQEVTSLRGYFESFYDEEEAQRQNEPKVLHMADYIDGAGGEGEGKGPQFDATEDDTGEASGLDDLEDLEDLEEDLLDEVLSPLTEPSNLGPDLSLVLDLLGDLQLEDVRMIQAEVDAALEEARVREGELDRATAGEITVQKVRDIVQKIPSIREETLEKWLADYEERVAERVADEANESPDEKAARERKWEALEEGTEDADDEEGPMFFDITEEEALDYRIFLTVRLVLHGFSRCLPMDADYLFLDYDLMEYDYDDEDDYDPDEP